MWTRQCAPAVICPRTRHQPLRSDPRQLSSRARIRSQHRSQEALRHSAGPSCRFSAPRKVEEEATHRRDERLVGDVPEYVTNVPPVDEKLERARLPATTHD